MILRVGFVLLTSLLLSLRGLSAQEAATKREPVPDPAKQKESEKAIRDLYRADYAKKAPADRQALAQTLLQLGEKSQGDPIGQFSLLKEAQEIAAQAGDAETALKAADLLIRGFEVDGVPLKSALLASLAKIAKTPEDWARLTERYLTLADDAVGADDYDAADKAAAAASQAAKKSSDLPLNLKVGARVKELAELKTRFDKLKKARETLAKTPDDPAACLEMGQFLCFNKDAWDQGLPLLAKGSDVALRALAERDLAQPTAAADQVALGDLWWDLAEKEKSDRKGALLDRVQLWYEKALPESVGIAKAKIEKRLSSMTPSKRPIDLLKLVDLSKDVCYGTWVPKGAGFASDAAKFGKIEIPYHPSAEYDIRFTFSRLENNGDVLFFMSQGGRPFAWVMSEGAFITLKGHWHDPGNSTNLSTPGAIRNGATQTIAFEVRKDRLKVSLDGKLLKDYKFTYADTGLPDFLGARDPGSVGICSYESPTAFLRVEITEIAARGRRVR